jgi:hypothetical protein
MWRNKEEVSSTEGRKWQITRENYISGNCGGATKGQAQTERKRIRKGLI